ncbi:transcriptional regulator with XRE-family HTH domain [Pseudogracilibacillus auburnensis]|uniref:Transcriptional regulator with XRE-family HTH domain n=1 Tax=Pseudogracilibacillus auburnensis TaxID=1494959 RepID=A0A2V3W476_9BACI|nr:transcriptional regulator with XRE-family HTH domain [Pseudogracilibacillus auburnensis]
MLGDRLKKLRSDKRITQEKLGKKVNVTKVSISGYENGNRSPDTETLQRLANYFEVSVDYLLGRTDNPNPPNSEFNPMDEINRLIKEYDIDQSGFFDIEKWKAMGPEEIKQLEEYFEFITSRAKNKKDSSKS